MVLGRDRKEWKAEYFQKVERILSQYDKVLVCDADNVTSKQFQQIRTGKNKVLEEKFSLKFRSPGPR